MNLCREDNSITASVVDKINIFRPDRVFRVMLQLHTYIYFLDIFNYNFKFQISSRGLKISFSFCEINYYFDLAVYSGNTL